MAIGSKPNCYLLVRVRGLSSCDLSFKQVA